jgi:hypothetical protein
LSIVVIMKLPIGRQLGYFLNHLMDNTSCFVVVELHFLYVYLNSSLLGSLKP